MASPTVPPPPPAGTLLGLPGSGRAAACGRRLWRGGSLPPPGPRRTPDHPPYAEMIQVALRALAEDGGSTADAISRRIAAVYVDLPWAHERLLPHYLRRLVAAGDVTVAAPGRYVLLSPSAAPAADANPKPKPNPSPYSQSTSFVANADGPAAPAGVADVTPHSSSSSATAALVDDGGGEGLGARTLAIAVAAAASGGDGESQCDRFSMPTTAAGHGGDEGRPSVPDPTSETAFVVRKERSFEHDRSSGAVAGHHTCFLEFKSTGKRGRGRGRGKGRSPLGKRGRGRPPKSTRCDGEPASGVRISDTGVGGILFAKCGKGRPPNSFILSSHGQESLPEFKPSVFPKRKRGRPPKCKPTMVTSDGISADGNVHLLNVASSYDTKHMKLDRDVHSSRSPGDGTSSAGSKVLANGGSAPRLKVILRLPSKPERSVANDSSTPDLSLLADQVVVPVPKRPRTSTDHKPRKISTTLIEERVSNVPLIRSSEPMVCALPASVQASSPDNIVRSRPQIEGWVQVLLAVQPTTANVRQAKEKKSRSHYNERKLVHPTVQFRPDNFQLSREVENVIQMDAWLQTSTTKQSSTDGLPRSKEDVNREQIERCIQLIAALSLDPNGFLLATEEENLSHVDRGDESKSNASFHAMEEENGAHHVEGGQMLPVGHFVPDGSLQTGKKAWKAPTGGCIQSLPAVQLAPADSLQFSMEDMANMGGSMALLVTGLSKSEDSLQVEERIRLHAEVCLSEHPVTQLVNKELENKAQDEGSIQELPVEQVRHEGDLQTEEVHREERIILHAEVHVPEPPVKQLVNKELENEPHDEGSIQKFPVEQSRPEYDLQAEGVNESDPRRCLQVLPNEDDLQTEDVREPPSMEILLACAAYTLGGSFRSQEVDNRPQVEESVKELYVQHFKPVDDLQSEKKNQSDAGNHMKVLPHEQAKLQDDFPFEKDNNGTHALECIMEFLANEPFNVDSSQMHQLQEGSHDELLNKKLSAEQRSRGDELQSEDGNQLCAAEHVQVLHEEQSKLGVDLLSEADETGRYAERYVPELPEKGPIHGNSLQVQELENRPQDEEFTHEISKDHHPTEDDLQRKDHVESYAGEHPQVFPPEQHKPGDDLPMEDRSRAHAERPVLQIPLEKSMLCDFAQMSESENNTQIREPIQDPPSDLSKPDDRLRMETTGLQNDVFLQSPGTGWSMTRYLLQPKGEKNVSLKKNKKPTRRLWFER